MKSCVLAVRKLVPETGLTVCQNRLPYVVRSTIGYHSNSWASC